MPIRPPWPPSFERAGAAAVSILVDERFAGSIDDLARCASDDGATAAGQGLLPRRGRAAGSREAGADAVLLLLRDLDDGQCRAPDGPSAPSSGSTHSSRRTTRTSSTEPFGSAPTRSASTHETSGRSRSTETPSSTWSRRAPRDRVVIAESGIASRAQGAAAELGGRRRDPRRLDADAGTRPRREARGADLAAAGQGVRPHPRGGRLRRGRRRRRPGRLRARQGEPSPRRRRAARSGDGALGCRLVGEPEDAPADLVQLYPREGDHRGRDAVLLRGGERSRGSSTSPGRSSDPATSSGRGRSRAG